MLNYYFWCACPAVHTSITYPNVLVYNAYMCVCVFTQAESERLIALRARLRRVCLYHARRRLSSLLDPGPPTSIRRIFVETSTGKSLTLDMEPWDTIADVKCKIEVRVVPKGQRALPWQDMSPMYIWVCVSAYECP